MDKTHKRYQRQPWQTPEQHAIGLAIQRQHDERRLALCRALELWHICERPQCRRACDCVGDMHACFRHFWSAVPEENKVWFRAGIKARAEGMDPEAAARAADAQVKRWQALRSRPAAHTAAVTPSAAAENQ